METTKMAMWLQQQQRKRERGEHNVQNHKWLTFVWLSFGMLAFVKRKRQMFNVHNSHRHGHTQLIRTIQCSCSSSTSFSIESSLSREKWEQYSIHLLTDLHTQNDNWIQIGWECQCRVHCATCSGCKCNFVLLYWNTQDPKGQSEREREEQTQHAFTILNRNNNNNNDIEIAMLK